MTVRSFSSRSIVFAGFVAAGIASLLTELLVEWLFHGSMFKYSISFIPVGAILLGVIGASGGLWLARTLHVPLYIIDLMVMLGIAVGTVTGIYFIEYMTATGIHGQRLFRLMSFRDFLPLVITKTHIHFNGIDEGEAGPWGGYTLFALQVFGFCAAHVGGYFFLRGIPRCNRCKRYLDVVGRRTIGPLPIPAIKDLLMRARRASWAEYVAVINNWRGADLPPKVAQAQLLIELRRCAECSREHLSEQIQVGNGEKWQTMRQGARAIFVPPGTSIRSVTAAGNWARASRS